MNKKHPFSVFIILFLLVTSCHLSNGSESFESSSQNPPETVYPREKSTQKAVSRINTFPSFPNNYRYINFKKIAKDFDALAFDFAHDIEAKLPAYIANDPTTWSPMGYWLDQPRQPPIYNPLETGYLKRTFGFPTYVGDNRVLSSGSEAIVTIGAVLGSTWAGIDKQRQFFDEITYDFVEMTFASYDTGSKLVHNYGVQGQSFWYDLFPQILFARLFDYYPETPYMREMVLNGANQWLAALPNFVKEGQPNYEFVGYNVVLGSPTTTGGHIEPPNGGLAFLFYSAYEITKDDKYLIGCKEVLDYLQTYQKNPNYEALTDYAPYVAAVLNQKYGTDYDIGKFLDFIFDPDSAFRPGWAVMNNTFGGYPMHGLVGQTGDYAFSMNSFHLPTTLMPLVKYEPRFATALGKYMLNVVSNSRIFFPKEHPLERQSMDYYLPFDPQGNIIYEGFRNSWNGINGYAMGDATTMFDQPSDLSLYSSVFLGGMGALVSPTDVDGILQIDLNATDSFGSNGYPTYMFYNPYPEDCVFTFNGTKEKYDLFDMTSNSIFGRDLQGNVRISLPKESALVLKVIPVNSYLKLEGDTFYLREDILSKKRPAVELINIDTRQELTEQSNIEIRYTGLRNDEVMKMKIYFNEILAYDGEPLHLFNYEKDLLPDTDYTLKVLIETQSGLQDYVTKRVICR
ncbi:MAG: hypothetical protein ACOX3K_03800 [Bacilli bacterium]